MNDTDFISTIHIRITASNSSKIARLRENMPPINSTDYCVVEDKIILKSVKEVLRINRLETCN